jgi:hypothetical protein
MTQPTINLPNGRVLGKTFAVYLTPARAQRLANLADFLAMCRLPYNPVALLDFMLDAADNTIQARMSE